MRWLAVFFVVLGLVELYSFPPGRLRAEHDRKDQGDVAAAEETVSGIFHVDVRAADGSSRAQELAEAAESTGARFLIAVDRTGTERVPRVETFGNVDVFVEHELATSAGHALVLSGDLERAWAPEELRREIAQNGEGSSANTTQPFVIAAHPSSAKDPWTRLERFPDAIEIMNAEARWYRALSEEPAGLFWPFLLSFLNEVAASVQLVPYRAADMVAWDTASTAQTPKIAVTGFAAHGYWPWGSGPEKVWPSLRAGFAAAQTVLLVPESKAPTGEERRRHLYAALRAGHTAIHIPSLFPFPGNRWSVQCGRRAFASGERVDPDGSRCLSRVDLPLRLPFEATVRLFRNGELVEERRDVRGRCESALSKPGLYRVEVWGEASSALHLLQESPTPYVFYNGIVVR